MLLLLLVKSQIQKLEKNYLKILKHGFQIPKIVSPISYVSKRANVGDGTIIMHGSIINAGAMIGKNCIINNKALIEHDAIIKDHCIYPLILLLMVK